MVGKVMASEDVWREPSHEPCKRSTCLDAAGCVRCDVFNGRRGMLL